MIKQMKTLKYIIATLKLKKYKKIMQNQNYAFV